MTLGLNPGLRARFLPSDSSSGTDLCYGLGLSCICSVLGLPAAKMTSMMPSMLTSLGHCADWLKTFFFFFCLSE